jgi:hypothetical protein
MCLRFCAQHSRAVLFTEREKKPNKTSRTRSLPRPRRPCPERIRSYTTLYHDRLLTHTAHGLFLPSYSLAPLSLSLTIAWYIHEYGPPPAVATNISPRSGHAKTGRHQQHDHNNTRRLDLAIRPLTNYYFSHDDIQRQVALYIKPGTSLIL